MNLPTPPLFIFQRAREPGGVFSSLSAKAKAPGEAGMLGPTWMRGLQKPGQAARRPGLNMNNPTPGASQDSLGMLAKLLSSMGGPRGSFLSRNSSRSYDA